MINEKKNIEMFESKIEYLEWLLAEFSKDSKLDVLKKQPIVEEFLKFHEPIRSFLQTQNSEIQIVILSVIAIGEGPIVFRGYSGKENLHPLMRVLAETEHFYDGIGGIIGYQLTVLRLIAGANLPILENNIRFAKPQGIDISKDSKEVRDAIRAGLEHLPLMGEIFPVGGAGDRLKLQDPKTNEPLPAAQLMFCGRTLLEGLIRDLQAWEFLYFKIFGKKVVTPIALMTSDEKDNDLYVRKTLDENAWFQRPKETFKLFVQPLMPVVTIEGHWSMTDTLTPTLKPGGHGAIWKLAEDHKVFEWFEERKRTKALVRQINNPIAGTDNGLIAFVGIGLQGDKTFGFASCFRLVNAAEGVVVLVEKKVEGEIKYSVSNIEYVNFEQYGIKDIAPDVGSPYSLYPSNTNILFVDLAKVREALVDCPIPGMLINMKNKAPYIDAEGNRSEIRAGRLETTMQNISDCIYDCFKHRIAEENFGQLKSYVTFNERRKTISVTKNSFVELKSIVETPVGCFYDMQLNAHDLLKNACGVQVPAVGAEADYLERGPGMIFLYHPALGPMYSIIAQKISGGNIAKGAELQLDIAEVSIKNLHLDGSLLILSENLEGKCILEDVIVNNLGINRDAPNVYWKNEITRDEDIRIVIRGAGEFIAKNVTFSGAHFIEVPDGFRVTATMRGSQITFTSEKIACPTWEWKYSFDQENRIKLEKRT